MFSPKSLALIVVLFVFAVLLPASIYAEWMSVGGKGVSNLDDKVETLVGEVALVDIGGHIKAGWYSQAGLNNLTSDGCTITFFAPDQKPLDFCCIGQKIALEDIEDPSVFRFSKPGNGNLAYALYRTHSNLGPGNKAKLMNKSKKPMNPKSKDLTQRVLGQGLETWCPFGGIVILRLGNSYGAIQPVKIENLRVTSYGSNGAGKRISGELKYNWRLFWQVLPERVAQRERQ